VGMQVAVVAVAAAAAAADADADAAEEKHIGHRLPADYNEHENMGLGPDDFEVGSRMVYQHRSNWGRLYHHNVH